MILTKMLQKLKDLKKKDNGRSHGIIERTLVSEKRQIANATVL